MGAKNASTPDLTWSSDAHRVAPVAIGAGSTVISRFKELSQLPFLVVVLRWLWLLLLLLVAMCVIVMVACIPRRQRSQHRSGLALVKVSGPVIIGAVKAHRLPMPGKRQTGRGVGDGAGKR